MRRSPRLRGRLGSVRARTTALATAVVAVSLALGAVALLLTLRNTLTRSADDAAKAKARDLVELAAAGSLPASLTAPNEDDIVQVVDSSGQIVAANEGWSRRRLTEFVPTGAAPSMTTVHNVPDEDLIRDAGGNPKRTDGGESYRVWALRGSDRSEPVIAYVATSTESVSETIATVQRTLVIGLPPLLGLLAAASWTLAGRALRPVEELRARVADISAHALDRRVPVPAVRDEVRRLAETMNALLARLETASDKQRKFVADASHELQSPLASLRTQLEVAMAHPDSTDWPTTGSGLLTEIQRMERLVRDLLFLARTDGSSGIGRVEPVDLDDVVLEEVARLRPAARVDLDTSGVSAAPISGSRDELTRLVRNLLENASQYAASAVRVNLSMQNGDAQLAIQDDGLGIPADQRDQVFARFTRLDDARRRDGPSGTGLGLAIAKEIADRHGGSIWIEDATPGTRFVAVLPSQMPDITRRPATRWRS
jgi:signal transduction histidine kinase